MFWSRIGTDDPTRTIINDDGEERVSDYVSRDNVTSDNNK